LDTGYTIVLSDQDVVTAVCGVNDGNLRVIEDYLGAPVITRGNELTVASDDAEICRKFQGLVDAVMTGRGRAFAGCPDALSSLIAGLDEGFDAALRDVMIQIPQGLSPVYARTLGQAQLMRALEASDMVFAVGPAGSGKTFIAVAQALRLLMSRQVKKLILTRPVVEAGESLGFLPGDLEQKLDPYLRPLRDSMEALVPRETIKRMEESGMIEIAPLAYMRGRTLANAVIILDEAQNTTREQMKMFLTRAGENSKTIITGDITQVDLPRKVESGLMSAMKVLAPIREIAFITMDDKDVVRNPLVKKIVQAYDKE
jgi:phosphate starvation-inducible PhoH-like protein